ncbi:MAG TPA: efflux RND transporter permease subunit, partial [Cellvibrionaceae bacterium]|nr:efflux RND transporter permease subunit [Cellvibrionaceae bacterium]
AAWSGPTPAILVNVRRQPGANVIAVTDQILALLPELQASLPAAVTIEVLSDRTRSIRAALKDVKFELCLAVALVVMVIFLFLRSAAATLIPSLAVPLSLVGTFGVMYLAGFSLNNLTLMALTIATGFVVDDAIVMIENIARHREMGKPARQAALDGAREIGFTIISLTFSLLAVLIPLLFMGDVVGRLFREFAITLAVAILISAVVSLTLTPMLCARLLGRPGGTAPAISHKATPASGWQAVLTARYSQALYWVVAHQRTMLALVVFTIGLTAFLALAIPKGFFPRQDTGLIQGISLGPANTGFAAMSARQEALVARLEADPAVASVASVVGVDNSNTQLNQGRLLISLKPRAERSALSEVLERLQAGAEQAGMPLFLQAAQDLSLDDRASQSQYQLLLTSPDAELLANWLPQVVSTLNGLGALRDVASDQPPEVMGAYIAVDRDTASRLGVSQAAVDEVLYNAFGQRLISTIFTQSKQYRVVLEVDSEDKGLARLEDLYVTGNGGQQIPLANLAHWSERPSSLLITRDKQFPAATISFNLAPGVSIGQAVNAIEDSLAQMDWPAGVDKRFQGAARAFADALDNQLWLIAAALLSMYIVLGVLYESYLHPLTILSTLPSAGIGALAALWACGEDLGVIAIIGIVLLIGIVQKNAIMIIDFALDAQRNQGKSAAEAAVQACVLRLRPIVMTSLAALLSAVPLVLGHGEGSELRRPLGISLIGGLLASQALTLFTTPVVYLAFDRLRQWQLGPQKLNNRADLAPPGQVV